MSSLTRTEKTPLTGEEICNIIEACALYQVTKFKYGDLQLTLTSKQAEEKIVLKNRVLEKKLLEDQEKVRLQALDQVQQELRSTAISELMISEPDVFEEEIVRGQDGDLEEDHGRS